MQRKVLHYSGLVAVSVFATWGYLYWQRTTTDSVLVLRPGQSMPAADAENRPGNASSGFAQGRGWAMSGAAAAAGATDEMLQADQARMRALAHSLPERTEPESRVEAIREMATVATPESLQAMWQTAREDRDVTVRTEAVDSLRLLAANRGDDGGQVRQTLSALTASPHAEVARRAREALEELDLVLAGQ